MLPHASRLRLRSRAPFATVLLTLWALMACETVEFGPDPADPSDTLKSVASLWVANQRLTDPGPLVVLLYPSTAQDIGNVAPTREYPEIAFEETATLTVAPGRYKVAYRMASGDLRPMPLGGSEGVDADWPVATFAAGKSYKLLIETDDGNHTLWTHDVPVALAP